MELAFRRAQVREGVLELGQQTAPRCESVDAVDTLLEDGGDEGLHDTARASDPKMREASMSFDQLGMFGSEVFGFVAQTEQCFGSAQEFRSAGAPRLHPDGVAIGLRDAVGHRTGKLAGNSPDCAVRGPSVSGVARSALMRAERQRGIEWSLRSHRDFGSAWLRRHCRPAYLQPSVGVQLHVGAAT